MIVCVEFRRRETEINSYALTERGERVCVFMRVHMRL